MTSKRNFVAASLLLAAALLPTSALAAALFGDTDPNAQDHSVIGAGVLVYQSPFRGEGTTVQPIPLISISKGDFYMESLEAGIKRPFAVDPDCIPSVQFFVSARNLAGEDRDNLTMDAGVRLNVDTDYGKLSVDYRHDVSGEFDGGEWTARYEISGAVGPVQVSGGMQANWQEQATANHMYGVDANLRQAKIQRHPSNPTFAAYEIDRAATNLSVDMTLVMPVADRLVAIGYVSSSYLGESIRQNPWMKRDVETFGVIGLAYRF